MKKLFMFLAVAGLATFGTACSSDDSTPNPEPKPEPGQLVVSASKLTPEVGETVTFTVKEGTADVTSTSDIYVNGNKISDKKLTSATAGEFKIVAKKADSKDSAAITVKFVEKGTELKKLVLTATPSTIELNAETVFKVTLDNADVTSTATIKVNGVVVTGGKYKGTVAGTYKAIASQAGAQDSAEVTITVKPADVPVPTSNFLKLEGDVVLLESAMFRVHTTADNRAKIYVTEDGTTKFAVFMMQANTGDSSAANVNAIFQGGAGGVVMFAIAVIQPEGATALILPGQGGEEQPLYTFGVINGTEFDGDELDETMTYNFVTPGQNGKVKVATTGTNYAADFSGDYTGLFVWNVEATGAAKAAKITSFKDVKMSLKAAKASSFQRVSLR